jgi:hypothetical protein
LDDILYLFQIGSEIVPSPALAPPATIESAMIVQRTKNTKAFGTPVMAYDSWGASPLYENEDLKEGSIPTVTPIEQVRDEGNCGEVTNRGEEACECVGKLTKNRRQPHSPSNLRGYGQKPDTRPVWTGE